MNRLAALVSTALITLAGAMGVAAAPAAAAADHVGVVVRFSGGNVAAGCTSVGGTGLDVLERLHTVHLGAGPYAGFVLTVDGTGTSTPDTTHYWSYWHSGGSGGWTYSSSGAGSYPPKAGTVEGWSYVDGQSNAPAPPSFTYAALCGSADPAPTQRSTPTRSSSTARSTTPAAPSSTAARTTRTGRAAATPATTSGASTSAPRPRAASSTATTSSAVGPTAVTPSAVTSSAARSSVPAPTSAAVPAPASTSSTALPSSAAAVRRDTSSSVPAWGTALALVVVALLGALALVLSRRRNT